uniref:Uncharacterized protein n=1 Tax=Leersia perrieri TaxID=77586 RepID=A0A0D9WRI7_9ORYZ
MDLRPATPRALFFRGPSTAPPASPARDFFLLAFRQWLSEKCRDFGGGWRFSRLLVFTEVVLFKQAVSLFITSSHAWCQHICMIEKLNAQLY